MSNPVTMKLRDEHLHPREHKDYVVALMTRSVSLEDRKEVPGVPNRYRGMERSYLVAIGSVNDAGRTRLLQVHGDELTIVDWCIAPEDLETLLHEGYFEREKSARDYTPGNLRLL